MSNYGQNETWKVTYFLPPAKQNNGVMGVALVEADTRQQAMYNFMTQYKGQFSTVSKCEKLLS